MFFLIRQVATNTIIGVPSFAFRNRLLIFGSTHSMGAVPMGIAMLMGAFLGEWIL